MAALKASLGKGAAAAGKAEPAHQVTDGATDEAEAHPRRGARRSEEAAPAEPKRAKKR